MFWLLSIIGAIVDSIFITTFYHVKNPIKRYPLLIAILTICTLGSYFIPGTFSRLILLGIFIIMPIIFKKEKINLFYFVIPYLLLGLISLPIQFLVGTNSFLCLVIWILQIFIIMVIYEDVEYKFNFKLLNITLKIIGITMLLLFLCLSKYYFTLR